MSTAFQGSALPPDEMLWTAREVAKHLRASISWVYKAAERGELPCIRLGAMLRFDPAVIRTWLGSRATAPAVTITRLPTEHSSE
jgi:excisionase family DNA binding protein